MRTTAITACCVGVLAAVGAHAEQSDTYPARSVRIVTGSVGSTSDQIARFTVQKLTERLGQQFIVDNRAGAAETIGTDIVVKAAPDGHTLTVALPERTSQQCRSSFRKKGQNVGYLCYP